MLTSEVRSGHEDSGRLIDVYVQQDEARGEQIRTQRASCKSKSTRPQRSGKRFGPGWLRE